VEHRDGGELSRAREDEKRQTERRENCQARLLGEKAVSHSDGRVTEHDWK
jgi:hypothetical protein